MKSKLEIKLWLLHRLTGMALALFVIIHLVTMVVVIKGGLTAADIMERTSGNYLMGLFYSLFVIFAATHGTIGLRTVAHEELSWKGQSLNAVLVVFCLLLMGLGLSAIKGLVL